VKCYTCESTALFGLTSLPHHACKAQSVHSPDNSDALQGDAPPPLSPVHQNGAALMEQNASKPVTPEPRLSQVSPFVSRFHTPCVSSTPA